MANGRLKAGLVAAVVFGSMLIGGRACSSEKVVERVVDESGQTVDTPTDGVPVEPTVVTEVTLPADIPEVDGTPIPDANTPTSAPTVDEVPKIELGPQGLVITGSNRPGNGTVIAATDIATIGLQEEDPERADEFNSGEPFKLGLGEVRIFPLKDIDDRQDDGAYTPEENAEYLANNGQIVTTVEEQGGLVTTIGPTLSDGMIVGG